MDRPQPTTGTATTAGQQGFSLIEVLITGVMVVSIALSTIPMFTQALANNTAGMDSTKVANEARGHLERLSELTFNSPELTLSAGAEKRTSEYFSMLTETWHPFPTPPGNTAVLWTRVTIVRQYGLQSVADGVLEIAEALDFDAVPEAVHLKEIEVQIEQSGAAFGPAKRINLKTLKVK
jgi:Tfp pilus assembly protein FimT